MKSSRASGTAFGLPSPGAADELPRSASGRSSAGCHRWLLGPERVQLDLRGALVAAGRQRCTFSRLSTTEPTNSPNSNTLSPINLYQTLLYPQAPNRYRSEPDRRRRRGRTWPI